MCNLPLRSCQPPPFFPFSQNGHRIDAPLSSRMAASIALDSRRRECDNHAQGRHLTIDGGHHHLLVHSHRVIVKTVLAVSDDTTVALRLVEFSSSGVGVRFAGMLPSNPSERAALGFSFFRFLPEAPWPAVDRAKLVTMCMKLLWTAHGFTIPSQTPTTDAAHVPRSPLVDGRLCCAIVRLWGMCAHNSSLVVADITIELAWC